MQWDHVSETCILTKILSRYGSNRLAVSSKSVAYSWLEILKENLKDMLVTLNDNPVPVRIYDVAKLQGCDSRLCQANGS
ncbi:MAG: hypothetical protein ACYC6W_11425 [Nitrosotalea sp.]